MELRTHSVNGLAIRHATSPRPGAPTLVLLNGWPTPLTGYRALWSGLTPHFHMVALELPGFGESTACPESNTPRQLAALLPRVLDGLECGEAHFFAPDVSVPVALSLAQQSPRHVASLTLSNGPASYPPATAPELLALMRWSWMRRLVAWTPGMFLRVARMRSYAAGRPDPEVWQEAHRLYTRGPLAHTFEYLSSFPTELPAIEAALGAIEAPCLVLWGDRDPFFDVQNAHRLAAGLPRGKLELLPGVGHLPHEDAPDRVADALTRWVSAAARTARQPPRPETER